MRSVFKMPFDCLPCCFKLNGLTQNLIRMAYLRLSGRMRDLRNGVTFADPHLFATPRAGQQLYTDVSQW